MSKCDDKSGYDHILLNEASRSHFGFQWGGWYFVCATLSFGWKESPFVYHTVGLAASGYFRSIGIPCSLYIDDRLNGELLTSSGPWSIPTSKRTAELGFKAANAALFIVLSTLIGLGYTIGIAKSCLQPTRVLTYLGFIIDSEKLAFRLPREKIVSFAKLKESILERRKSVDVRTLQRLQGKCISFLLEVPGSKLFIRTMSAAIGSASPSGQVPMSPALREEIMHWRVLDEWSEVIPWLDEKHLRLSLSTDASNSGWGCVLHLPTGDRSCRDYWSETEKPILIAAKELLALVKALQSIPDDIRDCRVDVNVDSQVVIGVVEGPGCRTSSELTAGTKDLFRLLCQKNLQIKLSYVPSSKYTADCSSRVVIASDCRLTAKSWRLIEEHFGGVTGYSFDLMALDSNVVKHHSGNPLPHLTPCASPKSWGINVFAQDLADEKFPLTNPYVFPPFCLVAPLVKFLGKFGFSYTMVVPETCPQPFWWPRMLNQTSQSIRLGLPGEMGVIEAPYNNVPITTVVSLKLYIM